MNINQEIKFETKIPFLSVTDFAFRWEINEHARLELSGLLDAGRFADSPQEVYEGTELRLTLTEEFDKDGESELFHGWVKDVTIREENGVLISKIKAVSGSEKLDREKKKESFQNPSASFSRIAKDTVTEAGGTIICTVKEKETEGPIICYQETVWEFLKRIASHQNSYVIPDIKTGKAAVWFGMRQGNEIMQNLLQEMTETVIQKEYSDKGKKHTSRTFQSVRIRRNYYLGDWVLEQGIKRYICSKEVRFAGGDLSFTYKLASEKHLQIKTYYNERISGMSLWGTVEERNDETIRLKYDMDQKEGAYDYPWRSETGNALYAVPEKGMRAAVCFMEPDERKGVAVRCMGKAEENSKPENKYIRIPDKAEIELRSKGIEVKKEGEMMELTDGSQIRFSGQNIEIEAQTGVTVKGKTIVLTAGQEIKATAE